MAQSPAQELADLKAKLATRENKPGLAANVEAIKARIEELENAT